MNLTGIICLHKSSLWQHRPTKWSTFSSPTDESSSLHWSPLSRASSRLAGLLGLSNISCWYSDIQTPAIPLTKACSPDHKVQWKEGLGRRTKQGRINTQEDVSWFKKWQDFAEVQKRLSILTKSPPLKTGKVGIQHHGLLYARGFGGWTERGVWQLSVCQRYCPTALWYSLLFYKRSLVHWNTIIHSQLTNSLSIMQWKRDFWRLYETL